MTSALLLTDIQNDFLPGGALAVPDGDNIVEVANRLMEHFPLIVATQDWHPADHLSFASQHPGRQVGEVVQLEGMPQVLWPDHCVQGSRGARFVSGLDTKRIDKVIHKGTSRNIDSYSGFYDNGHLQATGLDAYLRDKGVRDIYIMGLATDYCVRYTALDALDEGLNTYVIEDGCRGIDLHPGDVQSAVKEIRRAGALVIQSSQAPFV